MGSVKPLRAVVQNTPQEKEDRIIMESKQMIIIAVVAVVAIGAIGGGIALALGGGSNGETTYTLTYNTNGGTAIDNKVFTKDTDTFDLASTTRSGYEFLGWYENENFTGSPITQIAKGTEKDVTVYAKWQLILALNVLPAASDIQNNSAVKVTVNSSAESKTIPAAAVDALGAGKTLTVVDSDSNISWTFNGSADKQAGYTGTYEMDTTVTVVPDVENKKITLEFGYGDDTPGSTTVLPYASTITYHVGDAFPPGTLVTIENTGSGENIGQYPVDENGDVTFEITHCSDWVLTQYFQITLNANGGMFDDGSATTVIGGAYKSDVPQAPAPARTGYQFIPWVLPVKFTEDTTINANWDANSYTVVFDKNNNLATGNMSGESMTYDADKALTNNAFELVGHTFAGWATTANGEVAYTDGQSVRNLTSTNNGEVTLYAKWNPTRYSLTFNANGGSVSPESKTVVYGEAYGDLPEARRNGATFAGWNTAADGSGTPVSDQTVCNGQNLIIYAQWQLTVYTITYELDGGVNAQSNPATYTVEDTVNFAEATRDGFAFVAWFDAATGGNEIAGIAQGSTGNIIVYARWGSNYMDVDFRLDGRTTVFFEDSSVVTAHRDQNSATMIRGTGEMRYRFHLDSTQNFPIVNGEYIIKRDGVQVGTVTVNNGHGDTIVNYYTTTFYANMEMYTSQIILSGGVAVKPQVDPEKTGHSFADWMKGDAVYDFATPVTGVQTLTAAFRANQYAVTFNPANGSQSTVLNVTYGSEIENVNVPENVGHTFAGYFLGNTQYFDALGVPLKTTAATTHWLITQDSTLDAQWTANGVVLSFSEGLPAKTTTYGQAMPVLDAATYAPTGEYGKHFTGYFDAATGGNKVYNSDLSPVSQTCTLVGNTILYPQFEGITYTVVFNTNGGSGNMPTGQTVALGGTVTKPANDPTRSGYDFAGWSLFNNVPMDVFQESNTFEVPNMYLQPEGSTFTLYASWTPIVYTVIYDKNGGTGEAPANSTVHAGANFGLPEFGTTKGEGNERMYFGGWNTQADGQGTVYRGTVTFNDTWINMADNNHRVTLYVNWVASEFTPAVGYTFTGVQTNGPQETYNLTMTVIALGPTTYRVEQLRGNYQTDIFEFVYGMYPVFGDLGDLVPIIKTGEHTTGSYTVNDVEKNVDIYTKTVTAHNNNVEFQIYVTQDGFVCHISETINSVTTLYDFHTHQLCQLQPAEVTYRAGGATPSGDQVRTGSTYVSAEDLGLTKSGYRFVGWGYDQATYKAGDAITASRTVTAQWEQIVNPRTNIDWRVYNMPEGVEILIEGLNAFGEDGANGKTITVSGGTNWTYTAQGKVFSFELGGVTYKLKFEDEDNLNISSSNGQPLITMGEPDTQNGNERIFYWVTANFYMDLPSFGRYQPTLNDVFVYNEVFWNQQPEDHTLTVTDINNNRYTYTDDLGQRALNSAVGTYPIPGEYGIASFQYPDNAVNPFVWVRGQVEYGDHLVADCYIVSCVVYNQNYYSSNIQEMIEYEVYRYYIGVDDGLCYKLMERNADGELTDTFTLVSKPQNMVILRDYSVTMQFTGGIYDGQQSLNRTLSGPDANIVPIWEGHTFLGWALTQDGNVRYAYSNSGFAPGNFYQEDATQGAITLYAKWEEQDIALRCAGESTYYSVFDADAQTLTLPTKNQLNPQGGQGQMYTLRITNTSTSDYYYFLPGAVVPMQTIMSCVAHYELNIRVEVARVDLRVEANYQGGQGRIIQGIYSSGDRGRLPDISGLGNVAVRDGFVPSGYATSANGDVVYNLGNNITVANMESLYDNETRTITLYLKWVTGLIGHINANFNGAEPQTMDAAITESGITLPPANAITSMWTRTSYEPVCFYSNAQGTNGTRFDFGTEMTYQQAQALTDGNIYVIWQAADYINLYIKPGFNNGDPEFMLLRVDRDDTVTLPSLLEIDDTWKNGNKVPVGFVTEGGTLYSFCDELTFDDVSSIDGMLDVSWGEITELIQNGWGLIMPNYCRGVDIGFCIGGQALPTAEEIDERWERALFDFIGFATNSDGTGTIFQPGAMITVEQLAAANYRIYAIWEYNGETPRIYANFEDPMGGPYRELDEVNAIITLPTHDNLCKMWTNYPSQSVRFDTQADGEGISFALGSKISADDLSDVIDATGHPYLYVIWTPVEP